MTVTAAGFDLDAKYRVTEGGILITGVQALARVLFDQIRADRRRGLRTAAFVCGYPGSPLGGFDLTLQRTGSLLGEHDIHWEPGVKPVSVEKPLRELARFVGAGSIER